MSQTPPTDSRTSAQANDANAETDEATTTPPPLSGNRQACQQRVKTGSFERRWTLAKAGLLAGSRLAARAARSYWHTPEARQAEISAELTKQANYLVREIGKLKGSIVKIGQLMALWGEHYLPKEVTTALHQLEDQSAPLAWPIIEACLRNALGPDKFKEFDFDPVPVGAASFGQVHRGRRRSDDKNICFKIQYPGVADSIEADLAIMHRLLRMTRMIKFSRDFEQWMSEVSDLLRNEVDYDLEMTTTRRFYDYLKHDPIYHVPETFPEYSSRTILASSFESGCGINSTAVKNLSQARKNKLAIASLDLFWREIFEWGEMQTDPNFGNYFVRIDPEGERDELVLLDFGAVHRFDQRILKCGHLLIAGTFLGRPDLVGEAIRKLGFLHPQTNQRVYGDFYKLCRLALEPFLPDRSEFHDPAGNYHWLESNLINRILSFASQNALSTSFQVPPKELMYISRKVIGAYTLMGLLDAKVNNEISLRPFIETLDVDSLSESIEAS
jgi:predicted unusual protein kinase regulating ubiquinone biosynthesis (AarF/ABC1/UbiB family)